MEIQVSQLLELAKNQWGQIPKETIIFLSLAGVIFSFLNCFMGYRLRKVWGCILGIAAGAAGGGLAGFYFLKEQIMSVVCALFGALILGLLAWLLYKFGVFVMSTGLVYGMVISLFPAALAKQHIIALVVGVFAGTLALGYEQQMVIGITSVCGGIGGMHLLLSMTGTDAGMAELLLGLVLAAIGAVVQAAPLLRNRDKEARKFGLPSGRSKKGARKKKKIVKKTKVTHVKRQENTGGRKLSRKNREYDEDDYDDYDEEDEAESYENYMHASQKEEKIRPSGMGIDLDDLNRELSQEIRKICDDDK